MTKEQANTIIELLRDIRDQVTRTANSTARDSIYVAYSRPTIGDDPNRPQTS